MKIIMLWGQRRESYPGQYAPELLQSISENGDDENPDFINGYYRHYCADNDFTAIRIVEADISDKKLADIFAIDTIDLEDMRIV